LPGLAELEEHIKPKRPVWGTPHGCRIKVSKNKGLWDRGLASLLKKTTSKGFVEESLLYVQ
jgi:hypothetical protein